MSRTAVELAMRPGGGGTIVNITLSPHHGLAGMAHSSAARAAVEGYTRALAREWAPDGIAVLALAAGHFDTESLRKYPEPVWRAAARTVPLQRLGREIEHAWLVALAASPLGRALSGSVITLDGARDNWFGPWPPPSLLDDGERCRPRSAVGAPDSGSGRGYHRPVSAAGEVLWITPNLQLAMRRRYVRACSSNQYVLLCTTPPHAAGQLVLSRGGVTVAEPGVEGHRARAHRRDRRHRARRVQPGPVDGTLPYRRACRERHDVQLQRDEEVARWRW